MKMAKGVEGQDFAREVLEAFAAAGNLTDTEVKDAGGPSSTFMTNLRKVAHGVTPLGPLRRDTLARIDAAAKWKEGSARKFWLWGQRPEPAPVEAPDLPDDPQRALWSRIVDIEERIDQLERDQLSELYRLERLLLDPDELEALRAERTRVRDEQARLLARFGVSDPADTLPAAALDTEKGLDEKPGGSDTDAG